MKKNLRFILFVVSLGLVLPEFASASVYFDVSMAMVDYAPRQEYVVVEKVRRHHWRQRHARYHRPVYYQKARHYRKVYHYAPEYYYAPDYYCYEPVYTRSYVTHYVPRTYVYDNYYDWPVYDEWCW